MLNKIYDKESVLISKFGIDRVVLNKVILEDINQEVFNEALKNCAIRFDDKVVAGRHFYKTKDDKKFCYLKIDDKKLGTFKFGVNHEAYGIYQFSPKEVHGGKNLLNVTLVQVKDFLALVKKLVLSKYGITVNFEYAQIKEIEINTTFAIEYEFDQYERVLEVMFSNFPYLSKTHTSCKSAKGKEGNFVSGKVAYNKQLSISVYEKREEMRCANTKKEEVIIFDEKKEILNNDLMRIEVKLKNRNKIEKFFGKEQNLLELSSKKEQTIYKEIISYYFLKPYERWKIQNKKELRKILEIELDKGGKWKNRVIQELRNQEQVKSVPILLDVDDLFNLLKDYPDHSRHVGRRKKGFEFCEDDVFLRRDGQKYIEIIESLMQAINNIRVPF